MPASFLTVIKNPNQDRFELGVASGKINLFECFAKPCFKVSKFYLLIFTNSSSFSN